MPSIPPNPASPEGWPPSGWPSRRERPRRSPLLTLISVLGVLGALVLAGGLALLVVGRLTAVAAGSGSAASTASRSAGAVAAEADAGELARSLERAHAGVQVDWSAAPAGVLDGLDPGERVDRAPGVLIVETLLGPMMGTGTGITLTPDGLAVTNYHVVEDSSEVFVTVADTGRRHTAVVLGRDAEHDIAVLQIEGAVDLPTVSVSLTPPVRGDEVAAVGNGGGQGYLTAVRGEVLGVDRSIMAASEGSDDYARLTGLVQTEADVVAGYSGGPVVDRDGQVVAVTVAASDGTTAAEVDGFAIPLAVAFGVVEQVLSGEETDTVSIGTDGALGITVTGVDGVVEVWEVAPGSAAERIGLAPGDVVVAIEGRRVGGNASAMSRMVNDRNVGDRISVTWRTPDGVERTAEAVLQEAVVN
ncbi:S1C family serine protease [Micrococcus sp.]|uniref:S1C family serine protease n=1 Tax=Micrococcus sp. TaxID=1271 RepID=UPI002A91645B|nr:trypsin-like peptidase domain-containing protein [Micrococcus sp.]MDY6054597.1 trypsin-like peptidase domain-containing protein [Micrococcus sp.]